MTLVAARSDLPPLSALRAFDAAARHQSFAAAGVELHLSPGAIAHQVKQLEAWLEMSLFVRQARGVSLTAAGQRYALAVAASLDALAEATRQLSHDARAENVVTVSAMPSLVTCWLMPRLPRFLAAWPKVEVRVLASVLPSDLVRDSVDVAIRLGQGSYPGLQVTPLFGERFYAVASPALLRRYPGPLTPRDVLRMPMLHDEVVSQIPNQVDWRRWLASAGVSLPARMPGLWFSHTYLTLEAALAGQGVAIASEAMLGDRVERGLLQLLCGGRSVEGPYRYSLLRMPAAESRPALKAFCDWVLQEIGQEGRVPAWGTPGND